MPSFTPTLDTSQAMAIMASLAACGFDLHSRRIPNALTLGGAMAAVAFGMLTHGLDGIGASAAGWALGLALFLPFMLLGGLGAGDVKLMACLGAWLGPAATVWAVLYAAIAGAGMALLVAAASGYLRTALDNLYLLLAHFRVAGVRPHPELTLERGRGPRLPYALPIAVGTVAAMWMRHVV
ncbi:MAG: prepilin peptidase [Acidobacteria bacterium]|nr:prepilin peptidase [Acidobacteriota bacterium]